MMRAITDEMGYLNLVEGKLSKFEETLLRFPYTTYLCAICKAANMESEKVLAFHKIIEPESREAILSTADKLKDDYSHITPEMMSSIYAFVFCNHWFGSSPFIMHDKYHDSAVDLFFFRNDTKDFGNKYFSPPIGISKQTLEVWNKPEVICISHDRLSGRTHLHAQGIHYRILDCSPQEGKHLIKTNILLIDAVIRSQQKRSKGKGRSRGL